MVAFSDPGSRNPLNLLGNNDQVETISCSGQVYNAIGGSITNFSGSIRVQNGVQVPGPTGNGDNLLRDQFNAGGTSGVCPSSYTVPQGNTGGLLAGSVVTAQRSVSKTNASGVYEFEGVLVAATLALVAVWLLVKGISYVRRMVMESDGDATNWVETLVGYQMTDGRNYLVFRRAQAETDGDVFRYQYLGIWSGKAVDAEGVEIVGKADELDAFDEMAGAF